MKFFLRVSHPGLLGSGFGGDHENNCFILQKVVASVELCQDVIEMFRHTVREHIFVIICYTTLHKMKTGRPLNYIEYLCNMQTDMGVNYIVLVIAMITLFQVIIIDGT